MSSKRKTPEDDDDDEKNEQPPEKKRCEDDEPSVYACETCWCALSAHPYLPNTRTRKDGHILCASCAKKPSKWIEAKHRYIEAVRDLEGNKKKDNPRQIFHRFDDQVGKIKEALDAKRIFEAMDDGTNSGKRMCEKCKTGVVSPYEGCAAYRNGAGGLFECYTCFCNESCMCPVCTAHNDARLVSALAPMEKLRDVIKNQLQELAPMPVEIKDDDFKLTAATKNGKDVLDDAEREFSGNIDRLNRDRLYRWFQLSEGTLRDIFEAYDVLKSM